MSVQRVSIVLLLDEAGDLLGHVEASGMDWAYCCSLCADERDEPDGVRFVGSCIALGDAFAALTAHVNDCSRDVQGDVLDAIETMYGGCAHCEEGE